MRRQKGLVTAGNEKAFVICVGICSLLNAWYRRIANRTKCGVNDE